MYMQKRTLLGVSVTVSPRESILSFIKDFLSSKTQDLRSKTYLTIVTPNAEQIMLAQKNEEFKKFLNDADIALPDGAGVVWAMKKVPSTKYQVPSFQKISGVDFMEELCELASENDWPVAFIGGRESVAGKSLTNLQAKYKGLTGFAEDGPLFEITNNKLQITNYIETLSSRIVEEDVRFVFVGMGAPKQEYFISQLSSLRSADRRRSNLYNKDRHVRESGTRDDTVVFMSVGGSFDFLAGKIRRAPKCVRNLGFEWLWRLIQEPWRIRRHMVLVPFTFEVLKSRCIEK
jgi:N-acetylglucosaminyldiphosphoundecaprenol N-acetyl-beta-D-mannosaminyltransferase